MKCSIYLSVLVLFFPYLDVYGSDATDNDLSLISEVLERWRIGYETKDLELYMSAYWAEGFGYRSDMTTPNDLNDDLIFNDMGEERESVYRVFADWSFIGLRLWDLNFISVGSVVAAVHSHYKIALYGRTGITIEQNAMAEGHVEFTLEKRRTPDGKMEWRIVKLFMHEWSENKIANQNKIVNRDKIAGWRWDSIQNKMVTQDKIADWRWDSIDAKPQKFTSFDYYVIAVGTADSMVSVRASDVLTAFQAGKEIRLKHAEVQGTLTFGGENKWDVYFRDVYFIATTFTGDANFRSAKFIGDANFRSAKFTGDANFLFVTFTGNTDFRSATFTGDADFRYAKFTGDAGLITSNANFGGARFIGGADFSYAKFEKSSDFTKCVYSEKSIVLFEDVTGFSQMKIGWENDEIGGGLRGHLKYNEPFYIALIKNYQEMGWLSQADDAYYAYRKEKRKTRNALYRWAELAFVEIPFGYGVKPLMFLCSLLLVWVSFSCFYICFLQRKQPWYKSYRCVRFLYRYGLALAGWAIVHSFDNLTPGIDFGPLSTMLLDKGTCFFKQESKAVIYAESVQKLLGWYLLALFLVMFGKIWVR